MGGSLKIIGAPEIWRLIRRHIESTNDTLIGDGCGCVAKEERLTSMLFDAAVSLPPNEERNRFRANNRLLPLLLLLALVVGLFLGRNSCASARSIAAVRSSPSMSLPTPPALMGKAVTEMSDC